MPDVGWYAPVDWSARQRAAQQHERSIFPWARRAVIGFGVVSVLNLLVELATTHRWADYFHAIRVIFDNRGRYSTTVPRPPSPVSGWSALIVLAEIVVGVVYLIWQYRAATTARELGYPAKHSPGWGVAAWIVPVVNFWMPYQAVRECLPAEHSTRPLVARAWAIYIATLVIGVTVGPLLAEVHTVGVVVVVAQSALFIWLVVTTLRVVWAINEDHARVTEG